MPIIVSSAYAANSTAQQIINRALRLIGQLGSGESPSDDESADALVALNALLDSWRNEKLLCFATQTETLTLTSGTSSYDIGPSGDLNTYRPVAVEAAWVVDDGISYPVQMLTDAQYDCITDKTLSDDWPKKANYRGTMTTGTLLVYPVANATRTMSLRTRVQIARLSVADTPALPTGWEEALAANLAINLSPEYETEPRASLVKMARESRALIRKANSQPQTASSDLGYLLNGTGRANIETDGQ